MFKRNGCVSVILAAYITYSSHALALTPWEGIDFSGPHVSVTANDSDIGFEERAKIARANVVARAGAILEGTIPVDFPTGDGLGETRYFPKELVNNEDNGMAIVLALLEDARRGVPEAAENKRRVNEFLLRSQVRSHSGTNSTGAPCQRHGEWDVALKGLVATLYRYGDLLLPDVYDHVLNGLLNKKGGHDVEDESWFCGPVKIPESENHILNIETSRYLTNQLLLRLPMNKGIPDLDNHQNGMRSYILGKLQQLLQNDFLEYNARPYQRYSIYSIQNLYDYAEDPEIKTAAWMVLDYVSAKFAVSSNRLRRAAPFRRLPERTAVSSLFVNESDPLTWRYLLHSGNTQLVPQPLPYIGAADDMQYWSLTNYRVPYLIQDLIVNQAHKSYYQRLHHDGVEIYSSSGHYLISAGGIFMESGYVAHIPATPFDLGDEYAPDKQWALPLPTTLMPTNYGTERNDFIRLDGFPGRENHNTCVAPNFACGWYPVIPQRYTNNPERVKTDKGASWSWTFIDASRDEGFYVALYMRAYDLGPPDCANKPPPKNPFCGLVNRPYGFFEVAEASKFSFDEFRSRVLANNDKLFQRGGIYETTFGDRIEFTMPHGIPSNKYEWSIKRINDVQQDSDIGHWPLAEGSIINSRGKSGYVEIRNPSLHQTLVLDFTVVDHPQRTLKDTRLHLLCLDMSAGCGVVESAAQLLLLH
ncbi:MAG: hypothetical protein JSS38_16255 [Nitrospira sp.]|nr:hypothetical protein [Nitrospira sp.]